MADKVSINIIAEDDATKTFEKVGDSIDKLGDQVATSSKKMDAASDSDKKRVRGLADLKAGLDIAGKAIGVVKDFVEDSVKAFVDYAAQVRDLSRAIGANAEETSALIQVADDVGVSVGTLEAGFKAAIKNGIQPNIANLSRLSDEYKAIQDPVARSQFAMEKFGRAGLDMAKLLEQGGDAIKGAADEARKLGLTLDDKAVQAARDFEIALDNMGDKLEAIKLKVGKGVVPALNKFFDTLDRGLGVADQLANGMSTLDETENRLGATVARNVLIFGDQSIITKQSADALKEYLLIRQQVGMTEDETALRANMAAAATANAARATEEKAHQDNAATEAAQQHTAVMKEYSNSLLYAVQQSQAKAAADDAAAKADAIYRAGIGETTTKVDTLAQTLSKATDAQAKQILAQSQLDALRKAFEEGTISQEGFNRATDAVLLRYDLATPKSLAMADAQQAITDAFLAGDVPLNEYIKAAERIPKIAEDGTVTQKELASLGLKPTTEAAKDQTGAINDLKSAWDKVPREVETIYRIKTVGEVPSGGDTTIPGRAEGGPVNEGLYYLHNDEYVLSRAMRYGREPIPQQAIPAMQGAQGGDTYNYYTTINDRAAGRLYEDQQRRERLARSNARMGK